MADDLLFPDASACCFIRDVDSLLCYQQRQVFANKKYYTNIAKYVAVGAGHESSDAIPEAIGGQSGNEQRF